MEYLQSLMRYARHNGDPVPLCGRRPLRWSAQHHQPWRSKERAYTVNGINARAIQPERVAMGGELPYLASDGQ